MAFHTCRTICTLNGTAGARITVLFTPLTVAIKVAFIAQKSCTHTSKLWLAAGGDAGAAGDVPMPETTSGSPLV